MTLQQALLIVGLIAVAIIAVITLYPNWVNKSVAAAKRASKNLPNTNTNKLRTRKRSTAHEPSLHGSDDGSDTEFDSEQDIFPDIGDSEAEYLDPETNEAESDYSPPDNTIEGSATGEPTPAFSSMRQIDLWAKLTGADAQSREDILALFSPWLEQLDTSVSLHGLALPELRWIDLQAAPDPEAENANYKDIVASIPLMNGSQTTELSTLQLFEEMVDKVGQQSQRDVFHLAPVDIAHEQANTLTQFIKDCEGAIEVLVTAHEGDAFSGRLVETSAKQLGLDFVDGYYVRRKSVGTKKVHLYHMLNADNSLFDEAMQAEQEVQTVAFSMSPALCESPGRVVKEMMDSVKVYASRVSGNINVPGHDEFHKDQLLELVDYVTKLEKYMNDSGMTPGSSEALRVFSG